MEYLDQYCKKVSAEEEYATSGWQVDPFFQNQVWRWLTKHPDIKVGKDGKDSKARQWSLAAVQAYNKKITTETSELVVPEESSVECGENPIDIPNDQREKNGGFGQRVPAKSAAGMDGTTLRTEDDPILSTDRSIGDGGSQGSTKEIELLLLMGKPVQARPGVPSNGNVAKQRKSPIKLYACDDRLWWAAAGHGPDLEKIPRTYFTCLSIIASFREKGVAQPDLVRLSGQDIRSVPKRTQVLCEQGYIEKVPTFFNGHRTSHCILKRFVEDFSMEDNAESVLGATRGKMVSSGESKTSNSAYLGMIQYRSRIEEMLGVLNDNQTYSWRDLKSKMASLGFL